YVATRNVEQILDTMERLGIRYDLLARESEILHLHFWERAFQLMKERGVIHFASQGRTKGCWVMPFESHTGTDEHESDKIIVRSNGTVTYTGKDIAYQLWKLGQLGLDFNYKPFRSYQDGHATWVTTTEENATTQPEVPRPNFGGGAIVYNVIDSRQRSEEHTSELQSQSNLVCRLLLEKKKHAPLIRHCPASQRWPRTTLSRGPGLRSSSATSAGSHAALAYAQPRRHQLMGIRSLRGDG